MQKDLKKFSSINKPSTIEGAGVGDSLGERGWEGVRDGCWRRQGAEGCQGASAGEMMDVMRCDRLLLKSFRQISKSGIAA